MSGVTLYGMWTAVGKTVSVWLGGLDCGDYTVAADGSVTVPYQSDPDQVLTAAYLHSISSSTAYGVQATQIDVTISSVLTRVIVPCVIGYNYTSEGETLRPLTQRDTNSQTGDSLGKTRRVHMFGALLANTIGGKFTFNTDQGPLQFRSGSTTTWYPAQLETPEGVAYNYETLYNGVHWDTIDGDYNFDGVLSWQINRPYPCIVAGVTSFVETADR